MSSGGAPCGACKFLRRKCVSECIFAPYFDAEQGAAHFAAVHKIFGASNVSKLLQMIHPSKRCEAVLTICYEAQARLKDPVYGCVAHIFSLQQQVVNLQAELAFVQAQLANRLAASSALNESCISSATTGYGCSPYDHTVRMKEEGSYMLMDGDCYRTLQHQQQHQNNMQPTDHHSASSSSDLQALAHELLLRNTPSSSSNLGPPPPLSTSSP